MNTTRVRVAVRNFLLSALSLVCFLAVSGCGGGYGNGGGGGNGTAPYITTQPANQTVTAGQTATFSVLASGTAPLNYQWQKNGSNISGATSSTYTTPATTTSDNGSTFKVVVSNSAGSATSSAATLTVNAATGAPTIASLSPTSGAVGTAVTITGTNFGSSQGTSTVTFNGTAATPSSWSATSILAPVPSGATSGNVVVTVGGVASNGFAFTVATMTASAFPIKLSSNKRYFVDANSNPWLMVADAGHHLMAGLPQSSVATYLNDRKNNGFNTVNFYGTCGESGTSATSGTCQASGAAFDGTLPFLVGTQNTNYDLCGTTTPPCTSPNPSYWSQVDNVITQANNLGLVVLFDPIPWDVNFGSAMENLTIPNYPAKDFNFGVWLGNRYKNFPNIIWQFGQDFRHGALPDLNFMDYMAQVIAGVASVDTNHLITAQMNFYVSYTQQGYQVACNAQCTTGVSWNPRFGNAMNVGFVYTYYETYDEMLQAYNCGPGGSCAIQASNGTNSVGGSSGNAPATQVPPANMPVILGESNYETGNNTGLLSSPANAFITRLEMWYAMTSGGAGFEFGNEHVNHSDSSWQSSLDTAATLQVKYVANLLTQFSWWTFVPDTTGQVVTAGAGTATPSNANLYTATHATTTWDGGSNAIIYTPVTVTLTINMAKFSAPVTARWYDPTTGNSMATSCTSAAPCANTGTMNFSTPAGPHSDGSNANDWVLVLQ